MSSNLRTAWAALKTMFDNLVHVDHMARHVVEDSGDMEEKDDHGKNYIQCFGGDIENLCEALDSVDPDEGRDEESRAKLTILVDLLEDAIADLPQIDEHMPRRFRKKHGTLYGIYTPADNITIWPTGKMTVGVPADVEWIDPIEDLIHIKWEPSNYFYLVLPTELASDEHSSLAEHANQHGAVLHFADSEYVRIYRMHRTAAQKMPVDDGLPYIGSDMAGHTMSPAPVSSFANLLGTEPEWKKAV